jgi:hypothetical protein
MAIEGQTTLTVYGLDEDNKAVRADVFARKLRAFVLGLAIADTYANGRRRYQLMIEDLSTSSARARIREKQRSLRHPDRSGVETYEHAVRSIYNGDAASKSLPPRLITTIKSLGSGVEKDFAHAEVSFDAQNTNVIRFDEFMFHQAERAAHIQTEADEPTLPFYRGVAVGGFDGVLQVMDSRGDTLRAKLITTAGHIELDCVLNKSKIPEVRAFFDRRVRVDGTAHYDGLSQLPTRIDVNDVRPIKEGADLRRWRGAVGDFASPDEDW